MRIATIAGLRLALMVGVAGCGGGQRASVAAPNRPKTAPAHAAQAEPVTATKAEPAHVAKAAEVAEKPPAPLSPGESRPPAGHSEHREQMLAHGHGADHKVHSANHRFKDAAKWAKIFESEKRDAWQKGDAVVASLKLGKDARVADVGAGTGYFTVRFARQLRSGVVYAVDIEPTMVAWVVKRAQRERLENVVGVVCTASSAKLPGAVDVIFVSNTYHHIGERPSYFTRLHRKLRNGGRVVIVDFKMGKLPVGPPDSHKIAPDRIIAEMTTAGYRLVRRDDTTLPYQHLFEFVAK